MATWRERTLDNLADLDVEKVRHFLRWENVELECEGEDRACLCRFYARPSNPELPPIQIGLDSELEIVQYVGFGLWHVHFENYGDDRINVLQALRFARNLITREFRQF